MGDDKPFGRKAISVDEARGLINSGMRLMAAEQVALGDALGRVVSAPIQALLSSPPFAVSAMDGYAVRAADVDAPGAALPLSGVSKAGVATVPTLQPGTCLRIFTGAPVPHGADAIVIQEDVEVEGDAVRFAVAAVEELHIRSAGLNFAQGREIMTAGRTITARDIGLLAAAGHRTVPVRRCPRVAVLSTGDELSERSEEHGGQAILDANRPALMAAIRLWGAVSVDLGIAGDDDNAIMSALSGLDADLLVVTGGASIGDHDRVRPVLRTLGFAFDFWTIRMRPGKPLMFGSLGEMPVIGMPGNPVSALVCALLFLEPAIATMLGGDNSGPQFEHARLKAPIGRTGERDDYLRAIVEVQDGSLAVEAFSQQDSSMLSTLAASNALLFRPASSPAAAAGEIVKIVRLDTSPGF